MSDIEWEEVTTNPGNFAKFASIGDTIVGTVVDYQPTTGATTFDGDPCGYIVVADDTGEWHTITLDKGALKDPVMAANPKPGNLLSVAYTADRESKNGRTYKVFTVKIARTDRPVPTRTDTTEDEMPF